MDTLRYPTLAAWAKDMGDAIRERDGTTEPIPHQDMPDRVRAIPAGGSDVDLSQIQTKPENVLETETYMGADGEMHYGTMPEIADETITLDGTNTFHTMEKGHHGGGGVVRIVPDDTGNTFTPSKDRGTYDAPDGKVYTRIILEPIPDIYVDPTDASATAADVLSTATFYGKAGTKETGGIATKTGKQGSNVVSNGKKYIPVGYHDGTSYFNVNVSQTIVDGEDSTNCTAEASDVRYGETFRSGGSQKTGSLRTVSIPSAQIEIDTTPSSQVEIQAYTNATTTEGILPAGSSAGTALKTIPKYTGSANVNASTIDITLKTAGKYMDSDITINGMESYSGSYSITPSDSEQRLETAGKYLFSDIKVAAAPETGGVGVMNTDSGYSVVTAGSGDELPKQFVLSLRDSSVSEDGLICEFVYNSSTGYVVLSYAEKHSVGGGVSVYTIGRSRYINGNGQWNLFVENGILVIRKEGDWIPSLYFYGSYDTIRR